MSHERSRLCQRPTPPLPGMAVRNSHTCTNIGPKNRRTVPLVWDRAVSNQPCALSDLPVSLPICRLCAQLVLLERRKKEIVFTFLGIDSVENGQFDNSFLHFCDFFPSIGKQSVSVFHTWAARSF